VPVAIVVPGKLAVPAVNATAEPAFVPSILSCAVPVGTPAPGATGDTVAEKTTASVGLDGFFDDTTAVVVLALFTICPLPLPVVGSWPLLAPKFASPLYAAEMVYRLFDAARVEIVNVATPLASVAGAPVAVPFTENCTVPLGVPVAGGTGATVAVNVTASPNSDGLSDVVTATVVAGSAVIVSFWVAGVSGLETSLSVTVSVGAPAVPSL
jgi:hypothetical protein